MRSALIILIAITFSETCFAACAIRDDLIQHYGVSSFGFKKEIPKTEEPGRSGSQEEDWASVGLNDTFEKVNDGFSHSALFNRRLKLAWILRSGGIAGVHEWYGPLQLKAADFSGCDAYKPDLTILSRTPKRTP